MLMQQMMPQHRKRSLTQTKRVREISLLLKSGRDLLMNALHARIIIFLCVDAKQLKWEARRMKEGGDWRKKRVRPNKPIKRPHSAGKSRDQRAKKRFRK